MNLKDAVESLKLKFTSGNDVSVERATITSDEWGCICHILKREVCDIEWVPPIGPTCDESIGLVCDEVDSGEGC